MHTFLILARGRSVAQSQAIAVTGNPLLLAHVARAMLVEPSDWAHAAPSPDPVLRPLRSGRRRALQTIIRQTELQASANTTGTPA